MNLQPVTPSTPAFPFVCKGCNQRHQSGHVEVARTYADLDGKPFEAYYCERCAEEIIALTKK